MTMKRLILLLALLMTISVGYCQSRGGGSSRGTSPRTSTTVSSPRSTSTSSSRTYSPSRSSSVSTRPSTSYSPSRTHSVSTRPSVTSRPSSPSRTPSVNTRGDERPTYRGTPSGRPSSTPHPGVGHPHNPHPNVGHPSHPHPPVAHHPHPHHVHPYHHYHYHPHFHRDIYLHRVYWNPYRPVVVIDGFWLYTHNYYYVDYVTRYSYISTINNTMTIEVVDFVVDDTYTYCIEKVDYDTYFRVYDKDNTLVAQQKIKSKYKELVYDTESNGVWCMGKRDKDNLFFVMSEDGQLICYKE